MIFFHGTISHKKILPSHDDIVKSFWDRGSSAAIEMASGGERNGIDFSKAVLRKGTGSKIVLTGYLKKKSRISTPPSLIF